MKVINEKEFNELVIEKKGLVLVDFFATWCGPCKMLTPILEDVAKENLADIYKVDVDECFDLSKSLGIMSVPTMILYKDGEIVEKMVGLRQKKQIIDTIKNFM